MVQCIALSFFGVIVVVGTFFVFSYFFSQETRAGNDFFFHVGTACFLFCLFYVGTALFCFLFLLLSFVFLRGKVFSFFFFVWFSNNLQYNAI